MTCSLLVRDVDLLLSMDPVGGDPLGRSRRVSIAFEGDRVVFVGPRADAPAARSVLDGDGLIALPGLVDCHTHLIWGGSRADEFERRLAGESYSEILQKGGGILSTVRATRAASDEALLAACVERMQFARSCGVTLMEVKSGYGLDPFHEARLLRLAREAAVRADMGVRTTFLGAHAIPTEFRDRRDAYVRQVIEEQLPLAAPYADFIDVYVDRGAFTVEEGRRILEAGRALGLAVRVHAEQVDATGAALMAAKIGALSADHLERIDAAGARALAQAGTVGVLLPGAMVYLRDAPPPIGLLREAGVRLAVATDWNPGSSPVGDLWIAATLACISMRLSVAESLTGITRNAAIALGEPSRGWIGTGAGGDLALFSVPLGESPHPAVLVNGLGGQRAAAVVREGRVVLDREKRFRPSL